MTVINVATDSTLAPGRVLQAAFDFSDRRGSVFPAVSIKRTTVHELGQTNADVTEGTRAGPIVNWERCRYDWSIPGRVVATVTDSNVYAHPGSKWDITATPREDGGSHVEMTGPASSSTDRGDDSSERSSASSATASSTATP